MFVSAAVRTLGRGARGQVRTSSANAAVTVDTVNPHVLRAEYAVRGAILSRAMEIEAELSAGGAAAAAARGYSQVVRCNIGNPQALEQKPLSFAREVLALVMHPPLLDAMDAAAAADPGAAGRDALCFSDEVRDRARAYVAAVPSIGAYTDSQGVELVRREVASFIAARDGLVDASGQPLPTGATDDDDAMGCHATPTAVDAETIFLTDGASAGVKALMNLLVRTVDDAALIPIPQYPLYSAVATMLDGTMAPYYLDEDNAWGVDLLELRRALTESRAAGRTVRALVLINPGNPTGQSLTAGTVRDVARFCADERLVLLADEVYQENVFAGAPPFTSCRAALKQLATGEAAAADGADAAADARRAAALQLVSFHSTSKGYTGECGLRGGYFECIGLSNGVRNELIKMASVCLCSNVPGQFAAGLMVNPPRGASASATRHAAERDGILTSLERRARRVRAALDALPGIDCNEAEGALYLFPRITLPPRAVAAAAAKGVAPDAFYALALLEATGVVVVPGSGFGQAEGTFHFRTTFLPPEHQIDTVLGLVGQFHRAFVAEYE